MKGTRGIARRQQERLAALVSYARAHSRYFADLYREVPEPCTDAGQLPVVTKAELMRHFDDWVTDPAVTTVPARRAPRRFSCTITGR